MVRALKGDTLEDIVTESHINGHLERKWQSITYDATRNLAQADYEYSKDFFARLAQTLTEISPSRR